MPVAEASAWAVLPSCGGIVVFSGTARDHSEGRSDVSRLEYEAYEEQVIPRLDAIVLRAREQWPDLGRVALLHRIGHVPITESAVVVAVSAPHRDHAFAAARYAIAPGQLTLHQDRGSPMTAHGYLENMMELDITVPLQSELEFSSN